MACKIFKPGLLAASLTKIVVITNLHAKFGASNTSRELEAEGGGGGANSPSALVQNHYCCGIKAA